MASPDFDLATYYPIFAYLVLLILFVIGVMIATHTIGPNNKTAVKQMTYESGMDPIGDARQRFDVKFYLVAMIFLLFDIEVAFLYPWAMALRQLGWAGFVQVVLFMGLLLAGYVYVWRKGVLDWGPVRRPRLQSAADRKVA